MSRTWHSNESYDFHECTPDERFVQILRHKQTPKMKEDGLRPPWSFFVDGSEVQIKFCPFCGVTLPTTGLAELAQVVVEVDDEWDA